MSRSFTYQKRPKEAWRERANMKGGQFDTYIKPAYKLYKAKDGKNVIRILPPTWEKAKHYGYDIHVNYQIGPDNQSYLSLSKMLGKPDPIAEARAQAEREGDEALVKALQPTHRILMWVIDRLDEEQGPQLYPAPFSKVDKAFVNLAYDQDTGEIMELDNEEEGCDIRFYKEGSGLATEYPASKMRLLDPGPISDDEKKQQQWLDYIAENPIPDCLQFYPYDHISGVFNGGAPKPRDEEPEPESLIAASQEALKRRKQPEPEEADPEPEPEPVSRRARPRAAEPEAEAPKSGSIRDRIRARHRPAAED